MWFVVRSVPQMLVMAAIVATALAVPICAVLGLASFALFGTSVRAFVTFGGSLSALAGVFAWWAIVFVPALVYSAWMMPWEGGK